MQCLLKIHRLYAALSAAVLCATLAHAQPIDVPRDYDIPAGDLAQAVNRFSQQSDLQVIYDLELLKDKNAPALKGLFAPRDLLTQLLNGTGLQWSYANDNTIVLRRAAVSMAEQDQITVAHNSSQYAAMQQVQLDSKENIRNTKEADPKNAAGTSEDETQEIVVTGSHIRGSVNAASVIEISRRDIEQSGFTSTAQIIGSLAQNFSGGSSQVVAAQGTATSEFSLLIGTNTPSLRGLGDATLTLVDGHRLSKTGGTNGSDLASIPVGAIERVEVLPDGASSIYGSDAVAGVINVILRKDFDGVEAGLGIVEPTRSGGAQQQTYSLLAGTHWTSGNVLASYSRQDQDALFTRDRSFSAQAADPSTLIPQTRSDTATLYINQAVSTHASIYASALYNRRTAFASLSYSSPDFSFSSFSPGEAKQYMASAGWTLEAGADWLLGVDATMSRDEQDQQLIFAFPGSPSFVASISQPLNKGSSVEAHASGTFGALPAGALRGAFGVGVNREAYDIVFPLSPNFGTADDRRDTYAYAEFELPLVRPDASRLGLAQLDLSVSARMDRYSDFGTSTNPKVGLIYGINGDLRLRGSYAKSFRAPLLQRVGGSASGDLFIANDPSFAGATAVALYASGANPDLRPEASKSWTAAIDYTPASVEGLSLSAAYFSYDFSDKILNPVTSDYRTLPLSDPSIRSFVTFSPSAAQVQEFAAQLATINNFAGSGATLGDVQAILDNRFANISVWTAHGVDLLGSYRLHTARGTVDLTLNASRLFVDVQATPTDALMPLSGVVFGPPELKIRSGANWSSGSWSLGGFLNHLSGAKDIYSVSAAQLGAFTTVDLHVGYTFAQPVVNLLEGLRIDLTAFNALDRNPPGLAPSATTYPGIGYDSTNTSPLGRFLSLQVTKAWGTRAR